VKASGFDLGSVEPADHVALDLERVRRLRAVAELPDERMLDEMAAMTLGRQSRRPSIEAPAHAFVSHRFIDHTHPGVLLGLTNQPDGEARVRDALGEGVLIVPYVEAGLQLAHLVAERLEALPGATGMVWMRHGLMTWGDTPRESYERTVELVSRAERALPARVSVAVSGLSPEQARGRLAELAPVIRGRLALRSGDPDRPWRRKVLRPLVDDEVLELIGREDGRAIVVSPPLTGDYLIHTKPLPAWLDGTDGLNEEALRERVARVLGDYAQAYRAYRDRQGSTAAEGLQEFDDMPRAIVVPGAGVLCVGEDAASATVVHDIMAQALSVKNGVAASGGHYEGLSEAQLFRMEYRPLQHQKLDREAGPALAGQVALVTGAAGAIGSGICERLLREGALVALAGPSLDALVAELSGSHPGAVVGIAMDVGDEAGVARGFERICGTWGGLDLVVINAGLAHVAALDELALEDFQRLYRVNTEGTLLVLAAASRLFRRQGTGGDVVCVSTKNVLSPGARFGAYSATKAAAHQLARVASLELADADVRVNMVAPDAVFGHGSRRSGLWEEVGPDRMKARGLDPEGLEAYYQGRNLLRSRVTAAHVANAVLFFATRQTPTTGAVLPVDGGLPDATPR
jgi:rhamnose utilization protein RhaD (predicted bifunctional aldolase and dehydrogenase)/NAD(P)-dependent dehydrogenase (short-subunit alcohol dehydrogenase family)